MNITVYSKPDCPWCDSAKALLQQKNMEYTEKVLGIDYSRDDLRLLVGPEKRLTVPQIIIGNNLVGGYENLVSYLQEKTSNV